MIKWLRDNRLDHAAIGLGKLIGFSWLMFAIFTITVSFLGYAAPLKAVLAFSVASAAVITIWGYWMREIKQAQKYGLKGLDVFNPFKWPEWDKHQHLVMIAVVLTATALAEWYAYTL